MPQRNKNNEELMMIYRDSNPELAFSAFELLYTRTSPVLYSFLLKKSHKTEEAQDLLQKTYLKIHQCKELYNPKYKFEQWLFTIAKNLILDEWRKTSREAKKIANSNAIDDKILMHEVDLHLSESDRELLELKYIDNLTYLEISGLLNKTEVSLRKMVSRIIKKLNWENVYDRK
jgi:RNA polymerase sigma-70 factor (ECF subfamily)